jgi:hypothetical protein
MTKELFGRSFLSTPDPKVLLLKSLRPVREEEQGEAYFFRAVSISD